jgi:hypothetical protein
LIFHKQAVCGRLIGAGRKTKWLTRVQKQFARFLQKREFKKLEKGEALQIPQGYYLVRDEMWINDFTGASYHFVFMQLTATRRLTNNESKTNQRNE